MQPLLDWIKRTLSDDAGNPSALRHLCAFAVVVPVVGWLAFCIYEGKWVSLDATLVTLILGLAGILGGRKFLEDSGSTPPEDKQ